MIVFLWLIKNTERLIMVVRRQKDGEFAIAPSAVVLETHTAVLTTFPNFKIIEQGIVLRCILIYFKNVNIKNW